MTRCEMNRCDACGAATRPRFYDDSDECVFCEISRLRRELVAAKAQLAIAQEYTGQLERAARPRPVSEPPGKPMACLIYLEDEIDDVGWVEGYFDSRGRFGKAYGPCPCGATHWLPFPPAPEDA